MKTGIDGLREMCSKAWAFAEDTHSADIKQLRDRTELPRSVETFFEEYVYTVIASGFRARVAAEYTERILACLDLATGTIVKPLECVFKNKRKCNAIEETFRRFSGPNGAETYRAATLTWKTPEDLTELPMIGGTTCYQLARNIGLHSSAKPDVHMKRLFIKLFGRDENEFIRNTFESLTDTLHESAGVIDFAVWVYLSHKGMKRDCCYGGYRLR